VQEKTMNDSNNFWTGPHHFWTHFWCGLIFGAGLGAWIGWQMFESAGALSPHWLSSRWSWLIHAVDGVIGFGAG